MTLHKTDATDITPHGAPSERNWPAFLRLVLEKAAWLKGCSEDELAASTFTNAKRFLEGSA